MRYFYSGCSIKPKEGMQVPWGHRKLQFKNLLEGAGAFYRHWIRIETEIPRSRPSIVLEQQASQQQPGQTDDHKTQEAGLSRLVPRLLC